MVVLIRVCREQYITLKALTAQIENSNFKELNNERNSETHEKSIPNPEQPEQYFDWSKFDGRQYP